jgi:predicted Holliday junction resolvase-like endonuclease
MIEAPALALLVAAVVVLLLVSVRYVAYRARYRFSRSDVERERRDAAKRSLSVLGGRASEQLVPLLPEFFEEYSPSDARFLGSPVDYVVFDGLKEGDLRRVVLLEVKTGSSALNGNEREVRRAIEEGRVEFEVLRLPASARRA